MCAAVLYSAYDEFCLSYVPPDITGFARHLVMVMTVLLVSHANGLEVLEMLDLIESTRLQDSPRSWHDRKSGAIYYHPCLTDDGAD